MKKTIKLILSAWCLAACGGTVPDAGSDIDTGGWTLFHVDIESLGLGSSVLEGQWEDGARIGVFGSEQGDNAEFFMKKADAGLQAATFYGTVVKGSPVVAYFPFESGLALEDGALPCDLAGIQAYCGPEASVAEHFLSYTPRSFAVADGDGVLHFRYPMGLLEVLFTFESAVDVTAMTLSSAGGLSGRLLVHADGRVLPGPVSRTSVSLDFGGASVSTKAADGSYNGFVFVLPPASYGAGDLVLDVETTADPLHVVLPAVEVKRVEGTAFSASAVHVGAGLPGYGTTPGILE